MTDNRTTERVSHSPRVREAIEELMREKDAIDNRTTELLLDKLYAFLVDYQNILKAAISEEISEKETIARQRAIVREHAERIEDAIATTLGSAASVARLAERLRGIADEMRSVGASSMTPHELLAFYASDVDKVADSLMFAATLGGEREKELEKLVRDLLQLRCRQSCADCEHEDDYGCGFMTRALELGIEVY